MALRVYHRHHITGKLEPPASPALFVTHHGFGGLFDVNIAAAMAAFAEMNVDRPVTVLGHQMIWRLGLGPLFEAIGVRPATRASTLDALAAGHHVLVLPGGDKDAFKNALHRNEVVFAGRTGFAALAIEARVPVIPIVTAGGAYTAVSLSDGHALARLLRLDQLARLKGLPIAATIPWGVTVGFAGFLPYIPMPAHLLTEVLPPMRRRGRERPVRYGERVHATMQEHLNVLSLDRKKL